MELDTILTPERTFCRVPASSKKKAIEVAATLIAETSPELSANDIYTRLTAREKVSPTGLGEGIAIPHCRIPDCAQITGSLLTLENAVDFEAIDDLPVDTLFVLLVPESEEDSHLKVMAMLVERFQHADYRARLGAASSNATLFTAAVTEAGTPGLRQQQPT